jgi:hypothetical protein
MCVVLILLPAPVIPYWQMNHDANNNFAPQGIPYTLVDHQGTTFTFEHENGSTVTATAQVRWSDPSRLPLPYGPLPDAKQAEYVRLFFTSGQEMWVFTWFMMLETLMVAGGYPTTEVEVLQKFGNLLLGHTFHFYETTI